MWKTLHVAIVICLAAPAHADIASVYVQGNGGVASGHVNGVPEGNAAPEYEGALGGQLGARLFFAEAYVDHAAFARNRGNHAIRTGCTRRSRCRWSLAVSVARASAISTSAGCACRRVDGRPSWLIARAGGGLESSLGSGFFLGGAVEAEYFRVSPNGTSMFGDESRTGTDMFGYMYLKLQIAL
jgi:hypothetical protein